MIHPCRTKSLPNTVCFAQENNVLFSVRAFRLPHFALLVALSFASSEPNAFATIVMRLTSPKVIAVQGGNVGISFARRTICYDRRRDDGHYDLYLRGFDGKGARVLTHQLPGLPQENIGNPAWSPDGDWIVFQAEKPDRPFTLFGFITEPTAGIYNDLWILNPDTKEVTPLRRQPSGKDAGSLRPLISPDGRRLVWSEMRQRPSMWTKGREVGYWRLMSAGLDLDADRPMLRNPLELVAPAEAFVEPYQIAADGRTLLLAANYDRRDESVFRTMDLYTQDLETGALTRHTRAGNNMAAQFTNEGDYIVWAHAPGSVQDGADLWIMTNTGDDRRRLTEYNKLQDSTDAPFVVADLAFTPDGQYLFAYAHDGWKRLKKVNERIIRFKVESDSTRTKLDATDDQSQRSIRP